MRGIRSRHLFGFGACMLAVVLLMSSAPAGALSIRTSTEPTGPVDVSVLLDEGEEAGTVVLADGDVFVAEALTADGAAHFAALPLEPGPHEFRATLTGSAGATWTSEPFRLYSWGVPEAPTWITPLKTTVISPVKVRVRAGSSTATMTLTLNGRVVRSLPCVPGDIVDFGPVKLGKGDSTLSVVATSRSAETAAASHAVTRREWPYRTCIVIDKSRFKLYWVKDQQLIKTYPIAHGRNNWTPVGTWKVLAKYRTYPGSVYGPRKMRMFRRVGVPGNYRFVYTRYAIHGTNEPRLIGTMASHGCIRMYNKDVLELWPKVPLGTYVVTRP